MSTDLDDGTTVRAALERALRDVHAPTGLAPEAITAGRRVQGRRRLAVASGVAAVAAVAAVAVPLLDGAGTTRSDGGRWATEPPAPTPTAPPGGGTEDLDPGAPAGWWDMPADRMLAALEDLLPAGVRVVDPDPSGDVPAGPGVLDVVLEGPSGTGKLSILLRAPQQGPDEAAGATTATGAAGDEATMTAGEVPYARTIRCRDTYLACVIIRDSSGSRIGDVSTETDGGTTYHNADLLGPGGGAINLYVADSTGEKPGYEPPTADAPPLTLAQVRRLVEEPVWTSYRP